jgi:type II secretory pathway pseudopilin PulG
MTSNTRAISLIEIIVSMTLVLVLCIFVLEIFPSSLIGLRHSETHLDAQRVAEQGIEQLKLTKLSSGAAPTLLSQKLNGVTYYSTAQVQPVSGYPSSKLVNVNVSVRWSERGSTHILNSQEWVSLVP